MKRFAVLVSAWVVSVMVLSGCGTGSDATAKIAFVNNTGARISEVGPTALFGDLTQDLVRAAPTIFKMKLIAAYLAADIDPVTQNNTGTTAMIYLNNDCQDDIMHCDISAGTAEDGAAMSKIVTSFFDFGAESLDIRRCETVCDPITIPSDAIFLSFLSDT